MPLSSVVGAQSIVKPGVCTSTTRPASPYDGQVIYMTDVDQTAVWDGTQWTVLAPIAGSRNRIINGGFDVWQRGAGAFTTSNTYTADRWAVVGASGQTISVTQQSFTAGNAISGFEPQFHARIAWSGTPSGTFWFTQRVEDVRTFAGQQVVLSFWAKASASTSAFTPGIEQNFGTGGSSVVTTVSSAITLTTSWQRFSIAINVPSISGKTIGTNSYLDVRPLLGSSTVNGINIDIWGIQLEAGAVATPFEFENIGTTLEKCQRYYFRIGGDSIYSRFGFGQFSSATVGRGMVPTPTTMRSVPSSIDYSTLATYDQVTLQAITSLTLSTQGSSRDMVQFDIAIAANGSQYRWLELVANGSTSGYFGASAEL